jgi:hypothetical protein
VTAQSLKFRMERGDKMLTLFDQGVSYLALSQRFNISLKVVADYLREARSRRDKAKEKFE